MPLPSQLLPSQNPPAQQPRRRRSSADKPGSVQRTNSTSSLPRTTSNRSNLAVGTSKNGKHPPHHPHIAHTSASKFHRGTTFGHRVPSHGKGLNKLTALTAIHPEDGAKKRSSHQNLVEGADNTSMQRSYSEGVLTKKERRQSSSNNHLSRPQVRQSELHSQEHLMENKPAQPQVTFSTYYSDDEDDATMVRWSSEEIVESPQHRPDLLPPCRATKNPSPPKPTLKESLSPSTPRFLQKGLSQVSLVPPKVSLTNAVSKDITKLSTSVEQVHPENVHSSLSSDSQFIPSSNSTSQFISLTPPCRTSRTPDSDTTALRRNQSLTSLGTKTQDHTTVPLTTALQGKLTRTQQKLLLQRESTQHALHPFSLISTTSVSSPLQHTSDTESTNMSDYFSPLHSATQGTLTPGVAINIPHDVKVAREFDRISRELVNARRFGDPTTDAIVRLRSRITPSNSSTSMAKTQGELNKKPSAFGLNVSWRRLSDNVDSTSSTRSKINVNNGVLGGERKNKVRELMRRLWCDEVAVADITGLRRDDHDDGEDNDEEEEDMVGKPKVKGIAWSH